MAYFNCIGLAPGAINNVTSPRSFLWRGNNVTADLKNKLTFMDWNPPLHKFFSFFAVYPSNARVTLQEKLLIPNYKLLII